MVPHSNGRCCGCVGLRETGQCCCGYVGLRETGQCCCSYAGLPRTRGLGQMMPWLCRLPRYTRVLGQSIAPTQPMRDSATLKPGLRVTLTATTVWRKNPSQPLMHTTPLARTRTLDAHGRTGPPRGPPRAHVPARGSRQQCTAVLPGWQCAVVTVVFLKRLPVWRCAVACAVRWRAASGQCWNIRARRPRNRVSWRRLSMCARGGEGGGGGCRPAPVELG